MSTSNEAIQYRLYQSGQWEVVTAKVIVEAPVSLTVNGEVWLSFMCTPVDLEAMAVGFLFNEGLIHTKAEIASVSVCPAGDNIDVWLYHKIDKPERWRRTSGCTGGVTAVDGERASTPMSITGVRGGANLSPEQVYSLIAQLFDAQDVYRETGGVHTSALSDGNTVILAAEDIGRHNTLDKIAGRCILEEVDTDRKVIMTTGRISSEMLQKAARLGTSVIISRTSPSSLSIRMAEKWGITLIGYARRNRFQVYTHPERIGKPSTSHTAMEIKNSIKQSGLA